MITWGSGKFRHLVVNTTVNKWPSQHLQPGRTRSKAQAFLLFCTTADRSGDPNPASWRHQHSLKKSPPIKDQIRYTVSLSWKGLAASWIPQQTVPITEDSVAISQYSNKQGSKKRSRGGQVFWSHGGNHLHVHSTTKCHLALKHFEEFSRVNILDSSCSRELILIKWCLNKVRWLSRVLVIKISHIIKSLEIRPVLGRG